MNRYLLFNRIIRIISRRPGKETARRNIAECRFREELRRRLPRSFQTIAPGPPAPEHLIRTTAGMTEADVQKWLNPDVYFRTGYEQMIEFISALDSVSFNIRTLGAVFEFGCGSARLLRHLRCIRGLQLIGSDVNEDCIHWCRKNIIGIEFYQNGLRPPLTFMEAASVDLIMASSVFTHIPLEWQSPWLDELCRVLRPGGIFLCTILGNSYEESMLTAVERQTLQDNGHLVLKANNSKASLATQRAGSCDVFQTRSEIVSKFGNVFQILDYIDCGAGGQDLLVLQKNRHY